MGAETRIRYAPSTKFYTADRLAGNPWMTRLPFPVQVVEKVETFDHVCRTRFACEYEYHHGYYDGYEREFRGFAMVERRDAESYADYAAGTESAGARMETAKELTQPPVTTRTWFHTGAYFGGERTLHQLQREYYGQGRHLPDPVLPPGLDAEEMRECLRALKGVPLRSEIYSFDGTDAEKHPYSVTENNCEVRLVQARGHQRNAVFFVAGSESATLRYDRNPVEPLVIHQLNLEVDDLGNVLQSCSVAYGRKSADPSLPPEVSLDQGHTHVSYDVTRYTDVIDASYPSTCYRLGVPYETKRYELTGVLPASGLFRLDELKSRIMQTVDIPYEAETDGSTPRRRLTARSLAVFADNALNPLPLGQRDTLGLLHRSYRLAYTTEAIVSFYEGRVSEADMTEAGYVRIGDDAGWWIPSGTAIYPEDYADRFYVPIGTRDPSGLETVTDFDRYVLLAEKTRVRQAAWTETQAVNDYRLLGPVAAIDANKNRAAVEVDALGLVVKSAVMGKEGAGDGDTLEDPTARMEYDLFRWKNEGKPNFVRTFARERHGAGNPRWQTSYSYFNGSGGVDMTKVEARPGPALTVLPDGSVAEVDANPRWIGNGRTVLNNKGNPVKQYEPYFSATYEFEDEDELRRTGVTTVRFYDAVGRHTRTELPDGTFVKIEFDAWSQTVFDANDTVRDSLWYAERGSPDPTAEPEPVSDPERRAAWLAAKHAGTPGVVRFNSLGRSVYSVSDYGGGKMAATRTERDPAGRWKRSYDERGRLIAENYAGILGTPVWSASAEKGRRWIFHDALGAMKKTWDENGREFRTEYDGLRRPVASYVREGEQPELLFQYVVYGDRHPDAEKLNLLGTVHLLFDQSGLAALPEADFKGHPKRIERRLAKNYCNHVDWAAVAGQPDYASLLNAADAILETETFVSATQYDALGRPTRSELPDGSVVVPSYDEANLLSSLSVQVGGLGDFVPFLKEQDYDAKGQRRYARYGNEVWSRYFYDARTLRLSGLTTCRFADDPGAKALQKLQYTYDPVGNLVRIRDDAQQTHYFRNQVVRPDMSFEYDAIYQLIRAKGREHAGIGNDSVLDARDLDGAVPLPHVNDESALRIYTEEYEYDLLGNLTKLSHRYAAQSAAGSGWTRRYRYAYEDDPANRTNRLSNTSAAGDEDTGTYSAAYDYDAYGNMTRMPHLAELAWNFLDQLHHVHLGTGGIAYYVFGAGGRRIRKVIERANGRRLERISLGAVEIYRERQGDGEPELERRTLHVSDNAGRIAQVDTKTIDTGGQDPDNPLNVPLLRYVFGNHAGSATLATDEDGNVVSYEEYHPFGTTSYRSAKSTAELSMKRYRFSGKERDEETGIYYFGARFYAAWLGRWISTDPAGFADGANLYRYCRNNPVNLTDPFGCSPNEEQKTTLLEERHVTGKESFDELRAVTPPGGYRFDPNITPDNYKDYYHPGGGEDGADGIWTIWTDSPGSGDGAGEAGSVPESGVAAEPAAPSESAGSAGQDETVPAPGGVSGNGAQAVTNNPEGFTLEAPESFDNQKIAAYRERIRSDRGVGIRSRPADARNATDDIRRANQTLRDNFNDSLPAGQRAQKGVRDIDHTVELQHIIRGTSTGGAETVRPQDHRVQPSAINSAQGNDAKIVKNRQVANGAPLDSPAGGVARTSEMGRFYNQPGFRTAMRAVGYAMMAARPVLTATSAMSVNNGTVRTGGLIAAAGELGGGAYYLYGRFALGGANGFQAGLAAMNVGTKVAMGASGVAQTLISGYSAYEDWQRGDYTAFGFDAAAALGGVALIGAAAVGSPVLAAVGIATGVAAGVYHLGRAFDWW